MRPAARLTLALLIAGALPGAFACSSFSGTEPSAPGGDAGPTDDAAAPDAAGDSALPPTDAGLEDADAGPLLPFCQRFATVPALCADFEDGKAYSATLGAATTNGAATIGLAMPGFASGHALHTQSPAAGTNVYTSTPIAKTGTGSRTLRYALKLAASGATGTSAVTSRLLLNGTTTKACQFDIRLGTDVGKDAFGMIGNDGQGQPAVPLLHNPGNSGWFQVKLRLSTKTATGVASDFLIARVTIDGKDGFATGEVKTTCMTTALGASPDLLQLGIQDVYDNGQDVLFDDILFDGD